ncbi:MAG TPA: hypothetical protein VH765_12665 [Xanthobacteraceae bacterium]
MKTYLFALAAVGAVAVATPASAGYYIVRGPDDDCKIVETLPSDSTFVQVGPLSLATRDDAEREIRVVCKDHYVIDEDDNDDDNDDATVVIEKR